jgi:outer membrane lipoprotein-sorting protein
MPVCRRALIFSLMAFAATPALAAGKNDFDPYVHAPDFNAADKARIDKATTYLQNLGTASGRFEQTDFRGKVTQGNWYLARPGKMRFEYDAPSSVLIVSDGKQVKMWDPRLQTINAYPLSETPLSLFLARQIRFDLGVIVTQVTSNATSFTLKARDRRKQVEGFVTLGFNQAPDGSVALREWTVVDQLGRPSTIRLTSFKRDSAANAELFVLNKPQLKK